MKLPRILLKNIMNLWGSRSNNSLFLTPRARRTGLVGQPSAAIAPEYTIKYERDSTVQDSVLSYPAAAQYKISYSLLIDLDKVPDRHFGEGIRVDALADWGRTVNERKRQNKKIFQMLMNKEEGPGYVLNRAKEIANAEMEVLKDMYQAMAAFILHEGDFSEEAFIYYAVHHKESSLSGTSWSNFLYQDDATHVYRLTDTGKEVYIFFRVAVRLLCGAILNDSTFQKMLNSVVKIEFIFDAIRSRPGDFLSAMLNYLSVREIVSQFGGFSILKFRDRNAGGEWVISQFFWPIFKKELKLKLYNIVLKVLSSKIKNLPDMFSNIHGAASMERLKKGDLIFYDAGNAEKVDSQIYPLPFKINLSTPDTPLELGDTKFSGTSTTMTDMMLTLNQVRRAAIEVGYMGAGFTIQGGDNFATTAKMDFDMLEGLFDRSERFLGHDQYGAKGLKIVRDGAKTNESVPRRYRGYKCILARIPATSLSHAVISLGLSSINYWQVFKAIDYGFEDFETGGPHNAFEDSKYDIASKAPEVIELLKQAFDEIPWYGDAKESTLKRVEQDWRQPVSYKYVIQGV